MKQISLIALLISFTLYITAQTSVPTASYLLDSAYKQAAKEHKNVFIIFHAGWCVWCRKMDSSMKDGICKKYFNDNYVTVHLTINESINKRYLENPGASEFNKKYNGDKAGLPFWLIMDKKRNLLGDALVRPEGTTLQTESPESIGCPASEKEVSAFIQLLKKSSRLKDMELEIIAERFRKNDMH